MHTTPVVLVTWVCLWPRCFRMENREDCKKVIEVLEKAKLNITVKFADSGSSRRKPSKLTWGGSASIEQCLFYFR